MSAIKYANGRVLIGFDGRPFLFSRADDGAIAPVIYSKVPAYRAAAYCKRSGVAHVNSIVRIVRLK